MIENFQAAPVRMLVLSLTGRCNFACRYCYASEHSKKMMSAETAVQAVRLAERCGEPFLLQFSGGEPLLNFPALQAAAEYVKERDVNCVMQVQTNGSLLTEENARYLFSRRIGIGVSLDGRPRVNDRLRLTKSGWGASSYIMRGLEVLRRLHIGCGLTCVVTSENVRELEGIVDFAYFLGNVRRLGFDLLRGQGRGSGLCPPSDQEMAAAVRRVRERNEQLAAMTGYKIILAQEERAGGKCRSESCAFGHCHAMTGTAAFVDAAGSIYACASFVGEQNFYIGDAARGIDPDLRQQAAARVERAMAFCRECGDFAACGGGCLARWQSGKYLAECALKRAFLEKS